MDMLKKFFPLSFGAKNLLSAIFRIIAYFLISIIVGFLMGYLPRLLHISRLSPIYLVFTYFNSFLSLYFTFGWILVIIDYFKISPKIGGIFKKIFPLSFQEVEFFAIIKRLAAKAVARVYKSAEMNDTGEKRAAQTEKAISILSKILTYAVLGVLCYVIESMLYSIPIIANLGKVICIIGPVYCLIGAIIAIFSEE